MKLKVLLVTAILTLFLGACSSTAVTSVGVSMQEEEERALTGLRVNYRNSSLVVSGICSGSHINALGEQCYDLEVKNVFAGEYKTDEPIHYSVGSLTEGSEYLLFLTQGEDVHYAEDVSGFSLLSEAPIPIVGDELILDNGRRLSLKVLLDEFKQLSSIVSAPAAALYYNTLAGLSNAAEEIFIGRVASPVQATKQNFVVQSGGAMEKAQCDAAIVTIEAYGSIKGVLAYGDMIEIVHTPPQGGAGLLDSATLQIKELDGVLPTELIEDNIYVFFLVSSPDSKQKYYFPINQYQGYVPLYNEELYIPKGNVALRPYNTLISLVNALRNELRHNSLSQQAPSLILEE